MREILFKAKRLDNGEWVEGNAFFADNGKCEICIGTPVVRIAYEVNPDTVCQYTGLTDKNGAKIFEGDIVSIASSNKPGLHAPVVYFQEQCQFAIKRGDYSLIWLSEFDAKRLLEVTGNIYDSV